MSSLDFLEINLKYLRYWGLHPLQDSTNKIKLFLYRLHIGLGLLAFLWLLIGSVIDTFHKTGLNLSAYALNIIYIGAYFCGEFSIVFSLLKEKDTLKLLHEIQHLFKFETENHLENESMEGFQKFNVRLISIFGTALPVSTFIVAVGPLLISRDWSKLQLPICDWSPIDLTHPIAFFIAYLFQIYGQLLLGGICAAIDGFFVSMVTVVASEFALVGCELKNAPYNALVDCGIPPKHVASFRNQFETVEEIKEDEVVKNVILTERFSTVLNSRLRPVVQYHLRLLEFAVKVEKHFWSLIFLKIGTSLYYHVFMAFVFVTTENISLMVTITQYEVSALAELLMFAVTGQFLMNQSAQIKDYVYNSPWYVCPKSHQLAVKMVMLRTARVCKLSIGKMSDLTLPTFLMILKTAASYLAVLREITRE